MAEILGEGKWVGELTRGSTVEAAKPDSGYRYHMLAV